MAHADLRVRRARPDDRAPLLVLWERSVRATHHFLAEADIVALRPLVAAELRGEAVDWWVLDSGDRPIGFLGYTPDTIESLFIDPDHTGRGAGKRLVQHAQTLSTGALAVDVNEQNEAALGCYQAVGFVIVGRSPTDTAGRPFPLLHLTRAAPRRSGAA